MELSERFDETVLSAKGCIAYTLTMLEQVLYTIDEWKEKLPILKIIAPKFDINPGDILILKDDIYQLTAEGEKVMVFESAEEVVDHFNQEIDKWITTHVDILPGILSDAIDRDLVERTLRDNPDMDEMAEACDVSDVDRIKVSDADTYYIITL